MNRCAWANTDDKLMRYYHDHIWGRPLHNNQKLFELLTLEIFQAGLSWKTILHRKHNFEIAFHNFDPKIVKNMQSEYPKLLKDKGIIRNRLKIKDTMSNAQVVVDLKSHGMDLNHYFWRFVHFKPIKHSYRNYTQGPNYTPLSAHISRVMKHDGFKFCGKTIMYSFMQASGMVNDHTLNCFLRKR